MKDVDTIIDDAWLNLNIDEKFIINPFSVPVDQDFHV